MNKNISDMEKMVRVVMYGELAVAIILGWFIYDASQHLVKLTPGMRVTYGMYESQCALLNTIILQVLPLVVVGLIFFSLSVLYYLRKHRQHKI
jgi:hypothetical protein